MSNRNCFSKENCVAVCITAKWLVKRALSTLALERSLSHFLCSQLCGRRARSARLYTSKSTTTISGAGPKDCYRYLAPVITSIKSWVVLVLLMFCLDTPIESLMIFLARNYVTGGAVLVVVVVVVLDH